MSLSEYFDAETGSGHHYSSCHPSPQFRLSKQEWQNKDQCYEVVEVHYTLMETLHYIIVMRI